MKSTEKVPDLNDIIFEGRNKEYGAYVIGRLYNKYVSLSTTGAILLFILLVSYPLIMTFLIPEESIKEISDKVRVIYLENFITEIPADKKDIQLPKNVLPNTGTVKFLTPEIKADELVSSDVVPTQEDLVGNNPGIETVEGNINGNDLIAEFIGTGNSNAETTTKDQVYTWVEEMPAFPGGNSELLKFFTQNLIYPEIAKRAGVEGKVVLSFVVDKSGDISEVKVLKSIGAGCDEEAMRVLKIMPRWTAGKQNGNPVITRINIPVVFKLR